PNPFGSSGVFQVPIGGGNAVQLASGGSPSLIAADSQNVYWADTISGDLARVPVNGGNAVTIASSANISAYFTQALVANGLYVYWLNGPTTSPDGGVVAGGAVMRVQATGGPTQTIALAQFPKSLAIDSTSVYWTDATAGTVMKVAKP